MPRLVEMNMTTKALGYNKALSRSQAAIPDSLRESQFVGPADKTCLASERQRGPE